jgi:hypothetical protein
MPERPNSTTQNLALIASASIAVQGFAPTVSIHSRAYFSVTHAMSASYFTGRAKAMEAERTLLGEDERIKYSAEHRAYVSSSILLSVAFLEATINELFSDCADEVDSTTVKRLPAARDMALLWRNGVPRTAKYRLIDKYNKALELNGKPILDGKSELVKDIGLLIELRNALMHYEPETVLTYSSGGRSGDQVHKFEQKFKGKFELSPLTGEGNSFYPDKLLGYGCARWALQTAVLLVTRFCQLLDITHTSEHVCKLATEID